MAGNTNTPRIILGTMTFGLESSALATSAVRVRGTENVGPFLDIFKAHGHKELDTARIYGNGDTEEVLGALDLSEFKLATKVWPLQPGAHGPENLSKKLRESLAALKLKKVDLFYLHAPDYTTPFEVTAKAVNDFLSNFAAWQVTLIHQICKQNGYVLPTVYQGMYNPITRDVCHELFSCLKALDIAFYAYNPIAGGLLSGRYNFEVDTSEGGRFDVKSGFGKLYRERYWNNLFCEAVTGLKAKAAEHNITLLEATLRWMVHHSRLEAKDGIIIGASSIHHLEENLDKLSQGPLPTDMIQAFDDAWEHCKPACQKYFKDEAFVSVTSGAVKKD
ncbi:hypothetical protein DFQ27_004645 [Actinomortierella ambigua]|uniref:NADP-dependent oxidoreductase domain-containing protein n=1 Tax=Actinomortierella ambigua TaxID=1343610 RepID=A0A9P6Q3W8_9FUNG|nr:hypothetical protein DFQ27_004645 [Actinomortierella ambigua]